MEDTERELGRSFAGSDAELVPANAAKGARFARSKLLCERRIHLRGAIRQHERCDVCISARIGPRSPAARVLLPGDLRCWMAAATTREVHHHLGFVGYWRIGRHEGCRGPGAQLGRRCIQNKKKIKWITENNSEKIKPKGHAFMEIIRVFSIEMERLLKCERTNCFSLVVSINVRVAQRTQ